ncbi:MAG: hypothetical protein LBL95_04235 [Deltaproteobacteria bacterium]|jgi:hypothetical protein|nr:hypothetical protein [Deltaproteobacteria bacterium]
MSRQWFLAVEPPFELGQASLNGQPQVLTWQEDSQGRRVPGLQLRQGRVDLTADLRVADFRGLVPASGWGQNLFSTTQRFNLPPGYELFYVSGAKAFDQNGFAVSWWDRWTNLDLFIVLAVILSSFRLLGPRYAVLAAVALALSYHELMAPRLVFLHVLGATALLSVLPGRGKARFLARAWRLAACVFLAIVTVVFAIQEARVAIYPQLAKVSLSRSSWGYPLTQSWSYRGSFMPLGAASSPYAAVYEPDEAYDDYYEPRRRQKAADEVMGDLEMAPPRPSQASPMDKSAERQNSLIMTAPEAKAQNSLPRPDWEFRTIFLDYNGQVAKDQTVGLALIGPRVSSVLCFLRLVLMIWLVLAVISARGAIRFGGLLGGILPKAKAAAALALLAGALPLLLAGEARAQADWAGFPSPELLDDLRSRLLERADETVPGLPSLALSSPGPGTLRLSLSVQAARESLVALPRLDPKVFQPTRLFAEGLGDLPILATEGGERVALVPGGIHELVYEGRLADAASFQVSFEGRHVPGRVSLEGLPLWRLAGLDRNGVLGGRSLFVYTGPDDDDDDGGPAVEAGGPEEPAPGPGPPPREAAPDALRPFFRVDRTVSLGTEWKLYTTVSSFEPLESPFTLAVPLVAGEKPTTGGLTILRGSAILSFGPGHGQAASWESDLGKDLERPLELVAGTGPFAEAWSLDAATFWRVETRGPTPIYSVAPSGFWNPRWRPWPGETLSISVSRPEPIPGGFLVIDRAALAVTVGQENRLNALDFDIRSSFGGPYGFDLPQGAEIQSLSLDGQNLPSSSLGGPRVSVPLNPGQHRLELTWLETRPISGVVSTPGLDLGLPVANIDYRVVLPADRWTLLAGGPLQGPAVLFWSFAAAILIFCLCLGRLRLTPLSAASWFLLFLGLSQLSVAGAFLVAGWLLVFGLRDKRWPIGGPILFNLAQIALVIWTIFALVLIYLGIQHGLLEAPAMRVAGYSYPSDHDLKWFADRASGSWPEAWALSIPDRAYRILMLAWALWLAISLIRWSRWLWASFSRDGFWRKLPPRPPRVRNRPPMPGGPPPWGGPPQGPWPPAGMGPPPDGTAGPGPDPGQAPPVR